MGVFVTVHIARFRSFVIVREVQIPIEGVLIHHYFFHKCFDNCLGNVIFGIEIHIAFQRVSEYRDTLIVVGNIIGHSHSFGRCELVDLFLQGRYLRIDLRLHIHELLFGDLIICPHGDELVKTLFQFIKLGFFLCDEFSIILDYFFIVDVPFNHLLGNVQYPVRIFQKLPKKVLRHEL